MKHSRSDVARNGLLAVGWLLIGLLLRVWQFGWFPLREDEALYAYWARLIASGLDVMLERVAVDKPPFFMYVLARWFEWFGYSDTAGRSFNVMISFLTMVLVWLLARRLFGLRAGRWSLALYALSPFAISFASTLYMDPLLTLWIVLALLAASWRMGMLTGLALGMGFATKQTALLFIPLIVPALLLGRYPQWASHQFGAVAVRLGWHQAKTDRFRRLKMACAPLIAFTLGFAYLTYKIWQWDGWRILPATIPDFWTQSWHSYGGLTMVEPDTWPARLVEWGAVWRWWGGGWVGTLIIAGLSLIAVWAAWRRLKNRAYSVFSTRPNGAARMAEYWILLFGAFSAGYLVLHYFASFQTWDRYLLPLTPLSAILSAQGALWLWKRSRGWRPVVHWSAAILAALVLVLGAGRAAIARMPVGGDHGAYDGLLETAAFLKENTPYYHGVIYQRWLGWQWDWYLWGGPPRAYWADPEMLVANLAPHPTGYTRFVVFPGWHLDEKTALEEALTPLGLQLRERLRIADPRMSAPHFIVYDIVPIAP